MSRIFRFMSFQSAYVNLSVSNLARRVFVSALSDSILSCLRTINTFLVQIWKCNIRFASSKLEVCIIYLQKRAVFIADLIYKLLCCSIFTGFWPRIQLRRLIIIMQELLQAVLLFMNNPFGELLSKSVKMLPFESETFLVFDLFLWSWHHKGPCDDHSPAPEWWYNGNKTYCCHYDPWESSGNRKLTLPGSLWRALTRLWPLSQLGSDQVTVPGSGHSDIGAIWPIGPVGGNPREMRSDESNPGGVGPSLG